MNGSERQRAILGKIQQTGKVSVSDLAKEFNVAPMTIRRDLKELEATNQIKVQHGGAVLNKNSLYMKGMHFQTNDHMEEKQRIAKACIQYINEGDCIYLDSGTTISEIARLLYSFKKLTVVTNSLLAANMLADNQDLEIIMCPGKFVTSSMAYLGGLTNNFIDNFHFDKAFLSTSRIDVDKGLTVSWHTEGGLKKKIIQRSDMVLCAADSSKFDRSSYFQVCSLEEIDILITDTNLSESQRKKYLKKVELKQS